MGGIVPQNLCCVVCCEFVIFPTPALRIRITNAVLTISAFSYLFSIRLSAAGGSVWRLGDAQRAPRSDPVQRDRQRRTSGALAADVSRYQLARACRQLHRTCVAPCRRRAGKYVTQPVSSAYIHNAHRRLTFTGLAGHSEWISSVMEQ